MIHEPVISEKEMILRINKLKKEKNAVILSHYYMSPDLQLKESAGGIADFVGDSLGLSVEASKTTADYIVFCGVYFMAETAKILSPGKHVYIPDKEAGCSLASSITAADVYALKAKYPGVPVVAYINTYAETKAACDICCTSRNALAIIRSLDASKIIFIPDLYMGQNLARQLKEETGKELILWDGKCEVHEQFTSDMAKVLRTQYPKSEFLLHWEVPGTTVADSLNNAGGVLGSTNDIIRYVGESSCTSFILASECDLGSTLKGMYQEKEFITPCIKCPHMKKISILKTLEILERIGEETIDDFEVNLNEDLIQKAYLPIKRMMEFS